MLTYTKYHKIQVKSTIYAYFYGIFTFFYITIAIKLFDPLFTILVKV